MNEKIQSAKSNFNKIKEIRCHVMNCFNGLEIKLTKLKATTNEFIKNNKNNIFFFGLDSFQYQGKLIEFEYNDMKKFYTVLNNRMYCEYYKLFKLILNYAEEVIGTNKNIEMLKVNNIFPVYKDLEPLKQYNFETIEELHKTIIVLLTNLTEHVMSKEHQLQMFQLKQQSGLNINNFVNTFDYDVIMVKQKNLLYLSYLEFFHNIHTKHFKRFSKKMKLMHDHLDEDIKFDEGIQQIGEDDSMKSTTSTTLTYSFDFEEELTTPLQNTPNASNSNNIALSFNEIDCNNKEDTNVMLDTLTNSFNAISSHLDDNIVMQIEAAAGTDADAAEDAAAGADADAAEDTEEPSIDKTDKKKRKRNKKKK